MQDFFQRKPLQKSNPLGKTRILKKNQIEICITVNELFLDFYNKA